MANTITGIITHTEFVSKSMYGNPSYRVVIETDTGTEIRQTSHNAMIAYGITNAEYRETPHTFILTRSGRIIGARKVGA